MRQLQPVIWSKGTFLSPQHLQAQERFIEEMVRFHLESVASYYWGFSSLQIDPKALASGALSISSAVGIFPDALPLDIPGSDHAPGARSLEECFQDGRSACTFYLSIPQHRLGGMNVSLQRGGVSTRFVSQVRMLRDENTGIGEKSVQLAGKNLQLLSELDNLEGATLLPIARVEKTEAGTYRLAPAYVPPVINIRDNDFLNGILRSTIELLVARSSQLAGTRRQKNQSLADFGASDIANFWLLYTINMHLPVLRHLFEKALVHPEDMYTSLLELAGALTAFSTKIEPRDLPRYDHEALGECFATLDLQIRQLLDTVVPSNFISLPLKILRPNIYATSIDKDSYFENSRFYLAIAADIRKEEIISRAPQLLKACSATHIEQLINQALPGLKVTHVPSPPRALPVKLNYQYFSIDRTGGVWEAVMRARNFAVYSPEEFMNPVFELIILLPNAV
ncbi:MAG TPA: type VI secretion system baseplate subunit TssK [Granulicella sp.]